MSLNKVLLIGNVGKNPEIRVTQDKRKIATFSLATSERWRDKQTNEYKEKTEWHRIVILTEGLVGIIEKYIKKGTKLYIEGTLQTRKWTDASGVEKYVTEVVLQGYNNKLEIMDPVGSSSSNKDEDMKNNDDDFSHESLDQIDDEVPF